MCQEASESMDGDANMSAAALLHQRFRELFADEVRWRLKNYPVINDYDWEIKCFFSLDEFLQRFPNESARQDYVEMIESIYGTEVTPFRTRIGRAARRLLEADLPSTKDTD